MTARIASGLKMPMRTRRGIALGGTVCAIAERYVKILRRFVVESRKRVRRWLNNSDETDSDPKGRASKAS